MKLTIQIVNFRSRHYLRECLFSIGENLPADVDVEIMMINNDKQALEGIGTNLCSGLSARVIELQKNVGFGMAHNIGFHEARGEYVLFLNPDTKVLPGTLREMLDVFESDERIGIVGPLLVDSKNIIQADCFGTHKTPLSTIREKIFSRNMQFLEKQNKFFETDWVSGGAMMARKDVFEEVGGFDENFFMYFEDVDLCRRVKKMGHKVVVHPTVRVFHESGKSFESEREKKKHYYASQEYYLRKHFGLISATLMKLLRFPYYAKNIYFRR